MDYKFKRHRIDKISKDRIINELAKVAKHYGFKDFRKKDFDKISEISSHTVVREFDTWEKALVFLKNHFQAQGIELKSSNRRSRKQFTEQQLFEEMERIWEKIGHRPSKIEWEKSEPKISFATYMRYFNGWQNACLKFIEYKMGTHILTDDEVDAVVEEPKQFQAEKDLNHSGRTISLRVRLRVLDRDNFRCIFCGRSPATDIGVKLHIDHKIPFSQGGKSSVDNLQTLCQDCNLGKSDEFIGLAKA